MTTTPRVAVIPDYIVTVDGQDYKVGQPSPEFYEKLKSMAEGGGTAPIEINPDQEPSSAGDLRLNAIRETLWVHMPPDGCEYSWLREGLTSTNIVDDPSREQVKALLMVLPAKIIGDAVALGFDDLAVLDQVYEFIDDNKPEVADRVGVVLASDRPAPGG